MKKITIISLIFMSLLIVALVAVLITTRQGVDERRGREDGREFVEPQRGLPPVAKREGGARAKRGFQLQQIVRVLSLDEEREAKFRELYSEYIEATARRGARQSPFGRGVEMGSLTDEQIESSILESFETSANMVKIKESYYSKFREILSPREVAMMYEIERRVNERFQEEMRERQSRKERKSEL